MLLIVALGVFMAYKCRQKQTAQSAVREIVPVAIGSHYQAVEVKSPTTYDVGNVDRDRGNDYAMLHLGPPSNSTNGVAPKRLAERRGQPVTRASNTHGIVAGNTGVGTDYGQL